MPYPYAKAIPENGQLVFLDSGWMECAVRHHLRLEITKEAYTRRIRMVNEFERQLRDGGYIILKLFLHIEKRKQYERLYRLAEDPKTEWRVNREDLMQQKEYKRFLEAYDEVFRRTAYYWLDTDYHFGDISVAKIALYGGFLNEDGEKDTTQIGLSDRIGQDATCVIMLDRERVYDDPKTKATIRY